MTEMKLFNVMSLILIKRNKYRTAAEIPRLSDEFFLKKYAHRYDGLYFQYPIMQALAPYPSGRLLCGHRACLSRTLYGQLGSYEIMVKNGLVSLLRLPVLPFHDASFSPYHLSYSPGQGISL